MKRTVIAVTIASSLLVSGIVLARPGMGAGARFEKLDANGDGKVTLEEARTARAQIFARMDANKDGVVTREEASAARDQQRSQRIEERFAQLDANKDGKLTRDEVKWMPEPRFNQVDANGDNTVSKDELKAAKRGREQATRGNRGKGGPGAKGGQGAKGDRPRAAGGARPRGDGFVSRLDTDGDGKVSRAESEACVGTMFERHDANKDGILTRDEVRRGPGRGNGPNRPENGPRKPRQRG